MLVQRRNVKIPDHPELETPILLPSYSSKTSYEESVSKVFRYTQNTVDSEVLISAYDLKYEKNFPKQKEFHYSARTIFMDSGGYEASVDTDLYSAGKEVNKKQSWPQTEHIKVLNKWNFDYPTVLISYDGPRSRVSVADQITRARKLFDRFPKASRELLIKIPQETKKQYEDKKQRPVIDLDEVESSLKELKNFDVIGFTETELDSSPLKRMIKIAKIRKMLQSIDHDVPIHIFGSLDPISSPLYFLSGADIFDGLTWLRYAYFKGLAVYRGNHGALEMGIGREDHTVNAEVWNKNYFELSDLKLKLRRFSHHGDYSVFGENEKFFRDSVNTMMSER